MGKSQERIGHAKLSASESKRWINCPGSVPMNEDAPRYQNSAALTGTAAHALGAKWLAGGIEEGTPEVGYKFSFESDGQTYEWEADQAMIDGVQVYRDYAFRRLIDLAGCMHLEVQLQINENMWGTSDLVVASPTTLLVADYKNGRTPVKVQDADGTPNSQLLFYLYAAVLKFGARGRYVVAIVQPNCWEVDAVQELEVSPELLEWWAEYVLWPAYNRVTKGDATLATGDHCAWCNSKAECPKFSEMAIEVAGADFTAVAKPALPQVTKLTREQVLNVLKWAPLLDEWIREVQERAFQQLSAGEELPGWKLVSKKANRQWNEGVAVADVAKASGLFQADIMSKPELLSPAQVEKLGGAKAKKAIAALWHKPTGGMTMTSVDDPRKALDKPAASAATDEFAGFADDLI